MTKATTDDGIELYYEEAGSGTPLVFVHEFAGDHRSWEPQMRYFSRRYRCIVYAARGYPPSDVPLEESKYGQFRAVADLLAVLDAANIDRAHIVGNSMGGFSTLHFGLHHSDRARSLVIAGCGYGAHPDKQERFQAESDTIAQSFESDGSASTSVWYGNGPSRVQFRAKDPRGHAEHLRVLAEHDPTGAALTMRTVQKFRPSLYGLRADLAALDVPTLLVAGDEDEGALDTTLMLKRTISRSGMLVLPKTGHLTNLEEPDQFNQHVERFLAQVDNDRWERRDPRSQSHSDTGAS